MTSVPKHLLDTVCSCGHIARSHRQDAKVAKCKIRGCECGDFHVPAPTPAKKVVSVREHARNRGALDGADAQALEHALTQVENERWASEEASAKIILSQKDVITSLFAKVAELNRKLGEKTKELAEMERRLPIDGWCISLKTGKSYHLYRGGRSLCRRYKHKGPYTPWVPGDVRQTIDCKTCWNKANAKHKVVVP